MWHVHVIHVQFRYFGEVSQTTMKSKPWQITIGNTEWLGIKFINPQTLGIRISSSKFYPHELETQNCFASLPLDPLATWSFQKFKLRKSKNPCHDFAQPWLWFSKGAKRHSPHLRQRDLQKIMGFTVSPHIYTRNWEILNWRTQPPLQLVKVTKVTNVIQLEVKVMRSMYS